MSGIDTISITPDPEHLIRRRKVTKEENVIVMKPGPYDEPRRLNTSLSTWSRLL